ncbi:HD domain-containing phosphohydrolase [Aliidiomarina indica]|uniref:HD domain-containing phosphohydrolase n=1 Tax=Aliidiomarina indica TaxID=2749147 RepID=UPI0018903F36
MQEEEYSPVSSKVEVSALLETLMQPGAASIRLNVPGAESFPIVLLDIEDNEYIEYDLTAIRDLAPKLRRGVEYILLGQSHAGMIRSTPMKMRDFVDDNGRFKAKSDWPEGLDLRQRRAAFRAQLRIGMDVGVRLRTDNEDESKRLELMGDLRDLSATGCLVEFYAQDGASKVLNEMHATLEICFPDSTVFPIDSDVRHIKTDSDRQVLTVGFEFTKPSNEKEKQLWNFVREIEREASRSAGDGANRTPSPLFEQKGDNPVALGRRQGHKYATPIARRMARIAGYLDSQMVALRQSQEVNSIQLSAHAERLLDILIDDREGALFALRCIHRESPWVTHGLSVAIRMADLAQSRTKVPRDLLKAIVACGMIHDLGKGMLPSSLWKASTLSRDSYVRMQSHVALLVNQMEKCKWLAPAVVQGVIERVNERLDGSGYPLGVKGNDLGELARMAMIVDAVDAMCRPRPDRAGLTPEHAYRYLLTNTHQFDRNWIEAYIRHFGVIPVGSLIKYKSGQLAWVISLDDQRHISAVQLTPHEGPPDDKLGEIIEGDKLVELGEIREVLGAEA